MAGQFKFSPIGNTPIKAINSATHIKVNGFRRVQLCFGDTLGLESCKIIPSRRTVSNLGGKRTRNQFKLYHMSQNSLFTGNRTFSEGPEVWSQSVSHQLPPPPKIWKGKHRTMGSLRGHWLAITT